MKVFGSEREFPKDLDHTERRDLEKIYAQHAALGGWGWKDAADKAADDYMKDK